MISRLPSDEAFIRRILPSSNSDRQDRARAWADWQDGFSEGAAYSEALLRYVRSRNNTRESDEDILQEVLLTAYLGVESGRYQPQPGVPFIAYLVGIARNKIREARRHERWRVDLAEDSETAGPRTSGTPERQPERDLERREQHQYLRSGLSRLPAARRQVLEGYLAGRRTEEIAAALAISEELVRQHKCRGLRALQQDLTERAGLPAGWTG